MLRKETIHSFFQTLFGFRKARSPLHIVLIALVHLLAWSLLFLLPLPLYPSRTNFPEFLERELIDKLMLVALFYLHYYLLIPLLFERKRYGKFFLAVVGSFLLYFFVLIQTRPLNIFIARGPVRMGLSIEAGQSAADSSQVVNNRFRRTVPERQIADYKLATRKNDISKDSIQYILPPDMMENQRQIAGIPLPMLAIALNRTSSSFMLILLLAGFIRLSFSFIRSQNEKKVLENAQLNAEVELLRSQINPHFLFNTLNSIYSQAHAKSENTEHSILKLSEILRYALYDSGAREVPLENDIHYIRNYIELQRLRLSNRVSIDFQVNGLEPGQQIAPMLLISFIENAFKHGISYTQPSSISIRLDLSHSDLHLTVKNPIVENDNTENKESGGLGIRNVTRRLQLLYPGKHQLEIARESRHYIVQLYLNLAHD